MCGEPSCLEMLLCEILGRLPELLHRPCSAPEKVTVNLNNLIKTSLMSMSSSKTLRLYSGKSVAATAVLTLPSKDNLIPKLKNIPN